MLEKEFLGWVSEHQVIEFEKIFIQDLKLKIAKKTLMLCFHAPLRDFPLHNVK